MLSRLLPSLALRCNAAAVVSASANRLCSPVCRSLSLSACTPASREANPKGKKGLVVGNTETFDDSDLATANIDALAQAEEEHEHEEEFQVEIKRPLVLHQSCQCFRLYSCTLMSRR